MVGAAVRSLARQRDEGPCLPVLAMFRVVLHRMRWTFAEMLLIVGRLLDATGAICAAIGVAVALPDQRVCGGRSLCRGRPA